MLLFQKMCVLFLMMLVGYVLCKKQTLNDENSKVISSLVVNVANPALIVSSCFSGSTTIKGKELLLTLVIALLTFAFLIGISYLIPLILKLERTHYGVFQSMTVFSNIGFMGFPIISSLYGNSALLYASIFLIPYNVLIYTYGIRVIRKKTTDSPRINIKQIFNIGVIACILAAILYITNLHLPEFATSTILYLSNLTAPLSMIVIGTSLAHTDLLKTLTDIRLLLFSIIKLLIIPIAGCYILQFFVQDKMLLGVCIIMLATPVGSMTAMLAQQYGGDYELTSRYVVATTILSVFTIPIVYSLFL